MARLFSTNIYINTSDFECPLKLASSRISEKLDSLKKESKKWTFQNIFKRLKDTCFSPSRDITNPNFDQGAEKIAYHFQVKNFIIF